MHNSFVDFFVISSRHYLTLISSPLSLTASAIFFCLSTHYPFYSRIIRSRCLYAVLGLSYTFSGGNNLKMTSPPESSGSSLEIFSVSDEVIDMIAQIKTLDDVTPEHLHSLKVILERQVALPIFDVSYMQIGFKPQLIKLSFFLCAPLDYP